MLKFSDMKITQIRKIERNKHIKKRFELLSKKLTLDKEYADLMIARCVVVAKAVDMLNSIEEKQIDEFDPNVNVMANAIILSISTPHKKHTDKSNEISIKSNKITEKIKMEDRIIKALDDIIPTKGTATNFKVLMNNS